MHHCFSKVFPIRLSKSFQVDEGLYLQDGGRTWIRTMDLILIRDAL